MAGGKHKRRNVVVLGVAQRASRRGVVVTDITASDHTLLHERLLAKPEAVLALFPDLQIDCLSQIEGWDDLKASNPTGAARIIFVAATMGIPEEYLPVMPETPPLPAFAWIDVESSTVAQIAYDAPTETLGARFHSSPDTIYTYPHVTEAQWQALQGAPSKGQHVAMHYRKRKDFRKYAPEAPAPRPEPVVHPDELTTFER